MIRELTLSRFRGHTARYQFGPGRNLIKGKNETGKSTIKEAIAFAWMGTDSDGSRSPDHLIDVQSNDMEVTFTTAKAQLTRRKRRGATADVRLATGNMPAIQLTQTDLMKKLGMSPEVFMSCWCVGHFMKLKSEQRLKVLGEIAKLDRRKLLHALLPDGARIPSIVKLVNPRIDADAVAGQRRQLQNKTQNAAGALKHVEAQLEALGGSAPVGHEKEKALNEVEAQLQEWVQYDALLSKHRVDQARREAESALDRRLAQEAEALKLSREQIVQSGKVHSARMAELEREIKAGKLQIEAARKEIVELKATPPNPHGAAKGRCPTCHQDVSGEWVGKLQKKYEDDLNAYNTEARRVANINDPLKEEIEDSTRVVERLNREIMQVHGELERLRAALALNDQSKKTLEKDVAANAKANAQAPAPELPRAPIVEREQVQRERDNLKAEIHKSHLARSQRSQLENDQLNYRESITRYEKDINALADVEQALKSLPALETEKTLESIQISGVRLSLEDGELVIQDQAGVDYRCLSDGRKMKIDVTLALAIQRSAGPSAPKLLFIDNADLMDQSISVPDGIQALIAEVSPNQAEVQIIQL
jgi:hypothetical protein